MQTVHVPYQGSARAVTDLINGTNTYQFITVVTVVDLIKSGKLRALVVMSHKRVPALANVPTVVEASYPKLASEDWAGILVKSGTPAPVVAQLNAAINKALETEKVRDAFANVGTDVSGGTPEQFGKLVRAESLDKGHQRGGHQDHSWSIVGTGDFNGDGKGDILWRDTGGNTAIWLLNGLQVQQTGSIGTIPVSWSIVGTADFNGDGKADILWRDSSGNIAIWLMNGLQVQSAVTLGVMPTVWSVVATGDFNGDGKWDILWRDGNSGYLAIWLMNGVEILQSGLISLVPNYWAVAETGDKSIAAMCGEWLRRKVLQR